MPRPPGQRLLHVGLVALATFVAGAMLLAAALMQLDGLLLAFESARVVGVTFFVALMFGLAVRRSNWVFKSFLVTVCLLPLAVTPVLVKLDNEREWKATMRRAFATLMDCDAPASLSYCPLPAGATRDFVSHYKIAKGDLDRALARSSYKRINPTGAAAAADAMYGPGALSLGPGEEFYVLDDGDGGVMTLRVNSAHTELYASEQQFRDENGRRVDIYRR